MILFTQNYQWCDNKEIVIIFVYLHITQDLILSNNLKFCFCFFFQHQILAHVINVPYFIPLPHPGYVFPFPSQKIMHYILHAHTQHTHIYRLIFVYLCFYFLGYNKKRIYQTYLHLKCDFIKLFSENLQQLLFHNQYMKILFYHLYLYWNIL